MPKGMPISTVKRRRVDTLGKSYDGAFLTPFDGIGVADGVIACNMFPVNCTAYIVEVPEIAYRALEKEGSVTVRKAKKYLAEHPPAKS